jgi:hypothetical protein
MTQVGTCNDPFNYPTGGKADTMSMSTINMHRDGQNTSTRRFTTTRTQSINMRTDDIEGNSPFYFI